MQQCTKKMSYLPPGTDAPQLLHEMRGLFADLKQCDQGEEGACDTERALRTWLMADRVQIGSPHRLSAAALAFIVYLRVLSNSPMPPVDEIDGHALIATGALSLDAVQPGSFKQTQVIDAIYALRAAWVQVQRCRGLDQYIACLLHRTAALACFSHTALVLDDGRYSQVTSDPETLVCNTTFVLDMESFYWDATVQRQHTLKTSPAATLVSQETLAAVRMSAQNTLFQCIVDYANVGFYTAHWEFMLAPGERDTYHRLRPSLRDDARSVLALFRGHLLGNVPKCTETTLRDEDDTRSVIALCARHWHRKKVFITDTGKPVTGPSLRVAGGALVLVDVDGVYGGTSLEVLSLFLQRIHAPIDLGVVPRTASAMGKQRAFCIAD